MSVTAQWGADRAGSECLVVPSANDLLCGNAYLLAFPPLVRGLVCFRLGALAFVLQSLAHLLEFLQRCLLGSRKVKLQRLEGADDGRADHHAREPFMVGGH